jgi:acyl carrier protein
MKTRGLNYGASVGLEAYDIDWNSKEEIDELGRLCASQCIVFVNERIPTEQVYNIMTQWGDSSRALIHEYVIQRKISGRHWREILLNLGYIAKDAGKEISPAVSMVSYKKDDDGRPRGIFSNGELDWHSDQCAFDDAQRIIGLQSISDTVNSQTTFLCTYDAYESLSSDIRSMVKELIVKHKWVDGVMAPGLNYLQTMLLKYNMVPIDGMETHLYRETATGRPGIKFPSHTFNGFVGMSLEESHRVMNELKKEVYQDKYVYTQNWQDGQIVFMDQEITLHARPTNVSDGDKRTMARVITYLNHLYPENKLATHVRFKGKMISHDDFAKLVDADRSYKFEQEQKLKEIISKQFKVVDNRLDTCTNLISELDADSLDLLELVLSIERQFKIEIDEYDTKDVRTFGKILELIQSKTSN